MEEDHLSGLGPPVELENAALLSDSEAGEMDYMTKSQAWNLYTSHFLSTWNMRMYEFAAIIFTASAYPETLLATSVRGIVRTLASICFSSLVGRWIDRSPNRLKTLTTTIVANRISVIIACLLWFFIVRSNENPTHGATLELYKPPTGSPVKDLLFSLILAFGILETLSAAGNTLCMERDWVVVASSPAGKPYDLTQLNSIMRRIDLICKLIAPIFISIVVSVINIETGVLVVGGMSTCSFLVEWWCAKRVWDHNPRLRAPKDQPTAESLSDPLESSDIWTKFILSLQQYAEDFRNYFSSIVWVPSLALALLHISALAYSATLITFLLNTGLSLGIITIARAAGSVVEISSTVVTPIGVNYLSKAKNHGRPPPSGRTAQESSIPLLDIYADPAENGTEIGIFRLGLWGISWQLLNLVPVIVALWSLSTKSKETSASPTPHLLSSITLFFFLSTSRLGLWIYDLTTQQLTQTMTPPIQRSSFAGVENSFVAFFELMQNVVAIILHKPEHFKWIAGMSWIAVAISTVMYAAWVWRMRGHLIHWDFVAKSCECVKMRLGHR